MKIRNTPIIVFIMVAAFIAPFLLPASATAFHFNTDPAEQRERIIERYESRIERIDERIEREHEVLTRHLERISQQRDHAKTILDRRLERIEELRERYETRLTLRLERIDEREEDLLLRLQERHHRYDRLKERADAQLTERLADIERIELEAASIEDIDRRERRLEYAERLRERAHESHQRNLERIEDRRERLHEYRLQYLHRLEQQRKQAHERFAQDLIRISHLKERAQEQHQDRLTRIESRKQRFLDRHNTRIDRLNEQKAELREEMQERLDEIDGSPFDDPDPVDPGDITKCPLPTADFDIIVIFDGTYIRSDSTSSAARTSQLVTALSAGVYDIALASYTADASDSQEQWRLVLAGASPNSTAAISDVPTGSTLHTEYIHRSLNISGNISSIYAQHAAYPSTEENAVIPLCAGFNRIGPSAEENLTIVALGNSLVEGYGATNGNDFVSVLSQQVENPIINEGESGDTTETALARLDSDVLTHDPDIVVILLGGNDWLSRPLREDIPWEQILSSDNYDDLIQYKSLFQRSISKTETEANLSTIIERIHDSGATVVLLEIEVFGFDDLIADYDSVALLSDAEGFVNDSMDGILGNPLLTVDIIHPNDSGYRIMAQRTAPILQSVMQMVRE